MGVKSTSAQAAAIFSTALLLPCAHSDLKLLTAPTVTPGRHISEKIPDALIDFCRCEPCWGKPVIAKHVGVNFAGVDLTGADLSHANLAGADVTLANLADAMFCQTVMPDSSLDNSECRDQSDAAVPEDLANESSQQQNAAQ